VRTVRVDEADLPARIAKRDEVFAEEPDADRRSVGLGEL
jgi:hypothetical protein